MPPNFGPVYEVTHDIDPDIVDDFDTWLARHVEEMLELPGIMRAATYVADDERLARPRRVSWYRFESDADLERYLAGPAETMRQSCATLFGGRFDVTRRVLHETNLVDGSRKPPEVCLNCGTTLSGQYCGNCGQRARSRLISIWELLQEAFGDLFEIDSRLWRTLVPLAFRPGALTRDYLQGRRARFMPPFRTYLVLSLLFFLVAFFDPRQELGFLFEPEAEAPPEAAGTLAEPSGDDELRDNVLKELVEEGVISAEQARREVAEAVPADAAPEPVNEQAPERKARDGDAFNVQIGDDGAVTTSDCENMDVGNMPEWLATRLTPARLKAVCERIRADDGKAFVGKLLDNVPASLFVLLPLMALILKLLYPLSKRYYVEHLLFVVHFHAFVFLILTLEILVTRLATTTRLPEAVSGIAIFAVSVYIPVYLYKSMRRVYSQGHFFTSCKFLVLMLSYFIGLACMFFFAAVFAAFSI